MKAKHADGRLGRGTILEPSQVLQFLAGIPRRTAVMVNVFTMIFLACVDEFANQPPLPITIEHKSAWPDTLAVRDTVVLAIRISGAAGEEIRPISVEWRSSDPAVLEVTKLPPDPALQEDSLLAQLRARVVALQRGAADVSVVVQGGRGLEQVDSSATVRVMERWVSVTAGNYFVCALTVDRYAYCWGGVNSRDYEPGYGLGNGSDLGSLTPVAVFGGLRFSSLSAGDSHTCGAALPTGLGYCWGRNVGGVLGNGSPGGVALVPTAVSGGRTFRVIVTGGLASCGLTSQIFYTDPGPQNVMCWGFRWPLAVYSSDSTVPIVLEWAGVQDLDPHPLSSITTGGSHACGIADSGGLSPGSKGTAFCWGDNSHGQLGGRDPNDPLDSTPWPVAPPVSGAVLWKLLSAGETHTCGVTVTDETYCWGDNIYGQLGDGTTTQSAQPVLVAGGVRFVALSAGDAHTCGVAVDSSAYCWGVNEEGELGIGSAAGPENCSPQAGFNVACSRHPVRVADPPSGSMRWVSMSAGGNFSCGLTVSGAVYCWGNNEAGQLGDGLGGAFNVYRPVPGRITEPTSSTFAVTASAPSR
jgi:regulator of chromosome condensation (RCC1) repeat-containing protein/Regulator of Chromosome Condensation (RCC1) repeat protein